MIGLLDGNYEPALESFFDKIMQFLSNFKACGKSNQHFESILKVLEDTLTKVNERIINDPRQVKKKKREKEMVISKMYLLSLLYEIISAVRDYVKYLGKGANHNFIQLDDSEMEKICKILS